LNKEREKRRELKKERERQQEGVQIPRAFGGTQTKTFPTFNTVVPYTIYWRSTFIA
jgi:hypothetical protein